MFSRSQQVFSPLLLPMIGSILTVSIGAAILIRPPSGATLSLQQLLLGAAFDLIIVGCIHVVTVWCIWRLIREHVEPSAGNLIVHTWAAVVWLPLIISLGAERSLWISCFIPWASANAITFLNLWSKLPQEDEPVACVGRVLFQPPSTPPLWQALLPHCVTIFIIQAGVVALLTGHPWSATALISAGVMLFLICHPFVHGMPKSRRKFSRISLLQTAVVFFLISTALFFIGYVPISNRARCFYPPRLACRNSERPSDQFWTPFVFLGSGLMLGFPPRCGRKPVPPTIEGAPSFRASRGRACPELVEGVGESNALSLKPPRQIWHTPSFPRPVSNRLRILILGLNECGRSCRNAVFRALPRAS